MINHQPVFMYTLKTQIYVKSTFKRAEEWVTTLSKCCIQLFIQLDPTFKVFLKMLIQHLSFKSVDHMIQTLCETISTPIIRPPPHVTLHKNFQASIRYFAIISTCCGNVVSLNPIFKTFDRTVTIHGRFYAIGGPRCGRNAPINEEMGLTLRPPDLKFSINLKVGWCPTQIATGKNTAK